MKHYSGAIAKVAPTFDFNCFEKSNVGVPTEAMADGRDKARSLCLAFFCLLAGRLGIPSVNIGGIAKW